MSDLFRALTASLIAVFAACSSSSVDGTVESTPAQTAAPRKVSPEPKEPPAIPTKPEPINCDDACTMVALCVEEASGEDYRDGGECVRRCEESAAYASCANKAESDCKAYFECDAT